MNSSSDISKKHDYFNAINSNELISKKEQIKLLKKLRNGDVSAMDKLVKANLRLAAKNAFKYSLYNPNVEYDDLIQESSIGLMKAIEKFDLDISDNLVAYMGRTIDSSIQRYIQNHSKSIRIPVHVCELKSKLRKAGDEFEKKNSKEPTVKELSELTNIDKQKIIELKNYGQSTTSLDMKIGDEENNEISSIIPDRNEDPLKSVLLGETLSELNSLLESFGYREKKIAKHRILFDIECNEMMSRNQLADEFNVSIERIRQIENRILKEMRNCLRSKEDLLEIRNTKLDVNMNIDRNIKKAF